MIIEDIQYKFPFLSIVEYGDNEYIGIILNQDQWVTSMYVYSLIKTIDEKKKFLELGECWWWESNRSIPINIFLRAEMSNFKYCIQTLNSKDVKVITGPVVNLNDMVMKRIKRKNVQLIRKPRP